MSLHSELNIIDTVDGNNFLCVEKRIHPKKLKKRTHSMDLTSTIANLCLSDEHSLDKNILSPSSIERETSLKTSRDRTHSMDSTFTTAKKYLFEKRDPDKNTAPPTIAVVSCLHNENEHLENVTDRFIEKFNKHRGKESYVIKAENMLNQNCKLGGIYSELPNKNVSSKPSYEDIPSARHNLFLLTKLDNQKLKIKALNYLMEVLEKDPIVPETAFDLVKLAIEFLKEMDRERIQTQPLNEQICICRVLGTICELIQKHYVKKHLNGITQELKDQLIRTTEALEALNTQNHSLLHFYTAYALEGIKRIQDDRKILLEIFEFLGLIGTAGMAFSHDFSLIFFESIEKAFSMLEVRTKHSWYDLTFLFNELTKSACQDPKSMIAIQYILGKKWKNANWKFTFNAIKKLEYIALKGSTEEIRSAALKGQKNMATECPGILHFLDCHAFNQKTSFKPVVHLRRPTGKDSNIPIRSLVIHVLINIAQNSPDLKMRILAKRKLCERAKLEKNTDILESIFSIVPRDPDERASWKEEESNYHSGNQSQTSQQKNDGESIALREFSNDFFSSGKNSPKI